MNYFKKLVQNNTGVSAKNFFLVIVTLIGCLLLLVPAFTLVFEVIYSHTIATSLEGFAAYIASVASLFATAGITKAWSEKYECKKRMMEEIDYDNNNTYEVAEETEEDEP